jgi:hypothetical protein
MVFVRQPSLEMIKKPTFLSLKLSRRNISGGEYTVVDPSARLARYPYPDIVNVFLDQAQSLGSGLVRT